MAQMHQGEMRRLIKKELFELNRYFEKVTGLNPGVPEIELKKVKMNEQELGTKSYLFMHNIFEEKWPETLPVPKKMRWERLQRVLPFGYLEYALVNSPLVLIGGSDFRMVRIAANDELLHVMGYLATGYREWKNIEGSLPEGVNVGIKWDGIEGGYAKVSDEKREVYALSSFLLISTSVSAMGRLFAYGYFNQGKFVEGREIANSCTGSEEIRVLQKEKSFTDLVHAIREGKVIEYINSELKSIYYDRSEQWETLSKFRAKLADSVVALALMSVSSEKNQSESAARAILPMVYTNASGVGSELKEVLERAARR